MAKVADHPFCPYFPTFPHQPTTTSGESSEIIPYWRALLSSETGLEYSLRKLPQELADEIRKLIEDGKACQEHGDWTKAEKHLLDSRVMIMAWEGEQPTYDILLAWADLRLAQLYQSQGGADMLEKAMDMRKQILDCVSRLPFQSTHELLVRVCKTYYFTARYEWGASMQSSSEAKNEAIRDYAELLMCNEDEAEAQLCFLLGVDHVYSPSSANFDSGLFWIQEANRLWKKNAADGKGCKYYFLDFEAKLLMRLGKKSEAVDVLNNMSNILEGSTGSVEYVLTEDQSKLLPEVQEMLQECCSSTQIQQAHQGLAVAAFQSGTEEGYWDMKLPLTRERDQFYEIPASHPIMTRIPPFLGSSLGLLTADDNFRDNELAKLPGPISRIIRSHLRSLADQRTQCDWERITHHMEQIRGLLKITKRLLDKKTYNWLLSFFDIQLASLYQHHLRRFGEAIKVWHEIMDCVRDELTGSDHEHLARGYKMLFNAAMYECDPNCQDAIIKDHFHRVRNTYIVLTTRVHDSFFWLYFRHTQMRNFEDALRWLRESKWVNDELCSSAGISEKQCSTDTYFCCDYDYLHGEAELLMKLGKFEEAIIALDKLLHTKHVQEGSPMLGRRAKRWLNICRFFHSLNGSTQDEEFVKQRWIAHERSRQATVDNHDHEDSHEIVEQLPSPSGFILDRSDTIMETKPNQFKTGLEQHLHKLPVPFQLAIRKHSEHGCKHLQREEWENAIFEFEWCREILRTIKIQSSLLPESKACDWLLIWVSIPLTNIYHFRTKEFKKAFHLRLEVDSMIPNDASNEVQLLRIRLYTELLLALYQCSISDYPDLKNAVIKSVGIQELSDLEADLENQVEVAGVPASVEWANEDWLLRVLRVTYYIHGNFEVALHFARQLKQLFEQWFPGHEHDLREADYVYLEYECLRRLRRNDDALAVLEGYHNSTNLTKSELPECIQVAFRMCNPDKVIFGDDLLMKHTIGHSSVAAEYFEKILELRIEAGKYQKEEKFVKALECEKLCGELLNKIQNDGEQEVALDSYQRQLGLHHWRLAMLHSFVFLDKLSAFGQSHPSSDSFFPFMKDEIKAFHEDVDFTSAVQHFKESNAIASTLRDPHGIAIGDGLLTALYAVLDETYCAYFNSFRVELGKNREKATSSSVSLDILKEMQSYLTTKTPIQEYGEKAVIEYANLLKNMAESKRYSEGWIELLERHKVLYSLLQDYHYRQARYLSLYFTNLGVTTNVKEKIEMYLWNAFLYAEGERTRLMLYQIGGHKIISKQQWGFDAANHRVLEAIREDCASLLKGDSVFVQYSSSTYDMAFIYIYVIDQGGNLSAQMMELPIGKRSFQQILDDLYNYLEPQEKSKKKRRSDPVYNVDSMNKDLELLYDVLIRPIAHHLSNMKPEHKLILSPNELLTKVPFAALRDSQDQRYLIEKHTIALTPSLRVLQVCTERLQELQSSPPYTGFGSVVALGDPTYKTCKICKRRTRLIETGNEVEHIARLFGETAVVKLLRDDATVDQLLYWASKPSHDSFRQAIVHIGAHGVINEKDHRESIIQLACPIRPASSTDDSLSKTTAARGEPNARDNQSDALSDDEDVSDEDGDDNYTAVNNSIPVVPIHSFMKFTTESSFMFTSSQSTRQGESGSDANIGGRGDSSSTRNVGSHDLRVEDVTISKTRWKAELVVLSACRTSRGRRTAEGVLSLARSFIIAGVPCVVASLWNVDDKATRALMEVFYDELGKGCDVSSALRSAMLHRMHMSQEHRDAVREWAPFNVWGVPSLQIPKELQRNPNESSLVDLKMAIPHKEIGLEGPANNTGENSNESSQEDLKMHKEMGNLEGPANNIGEKQNEASVVDLKMAISQKEIGDLEGPANNIGENPNESSVVDLKMVIPQKEICDSKGPSINIGESSTSSREVSAEDFEGFRLNEENGVCMRMAARRMTISWSDDRRYWDWIPDQNSVFPEVALLRAVYWFDARGEIDCSTLPLGNYTLAWRILLTKENMLNNGWRFEPAHFTLSKNGADEMECKCFMSTSPQVCGQPIGQFRLPTIRIMENGWREYDVGEFSVLRDDQSCVLKFAMKTINSMWKFGMRMDGIVIRPHSSSMPQEER